MDSLAFAMRRATTPHKHQHTRLPSCVVFVGKKIVPIFLNGAKKLLRPMALFASLLGRPQILDRRFNRAMVFIKKDRINLISSREFRAHIPIDPGADMALDASDAGMNRNIATRGALSILASVGFE